VYLGGRFQGNIDLDPSSAVANFPNFAGLDGFVAKYGPTGNYISGFTYNGNVYNMTLDGSGNRYVSGSITDSMDVDPGPGKAMLYSVNSFDTYIVKYDASGNYLHARASVNDGITVLTDLAVSPQSEAYLTGRFNDTADYNSGNSPGRLITQGALDGFVVKFDPAGTVAGSASFGSTGSDYVEAVTADQQGNVWISGEFLGTVDFDPGTGTSNFTSTATKGMFFGRYGTPTTGMSHTAAESLPIKVYGADDAVVVDFTAMGTVTAEVKVLNLVGQTVAGATHRRADMLRLALPETAGQVYLVVVSNAGSLVTKKVWVR
jgi:hypothetical protein